IDRKDEWSLPRELGDGRGERAQRAVTPVWLGERAGALDRSDMQGVAEGSERAPRLGFDAIPDHGLRTEGTRSCEEHAEWPTLADPRIAREQCDPAPVRGRFG